MLLVYFKLVSNFNKKPYLNYPKTFFFSLQIFNCQNFDLYKRNEPDENIESRQFFYE